MSWMKLAKRARSATISPPNATTKVRPPKSCTYGATWRSQRTNASGCGGVLIVRVIFSNSIGYCRTPRVRYAGSEEVVMKAIIVFLFAAIALPAHAGQDEDWSTFG